MAEKLNELKTKISENWTTITTWFKNNVAPKFTKEYWKTKVSGIKSGISTKVGEIKGSLSSHWTTITTWFKNNVANKLTLTYWTNKFANIKDGLKAGLNGALGNIEKFINNIAKKLGMGKVQKALAALGIEVNLSEIKIPRLATGGIAVSSTLANIGEAGKEAVLPLENNTGWMDTLADRIASRNSSPSKIVLMVGEKELGYATINSINNITRQTGALQLALV
jgi:hypothetical protein